MQHGRFHVSPREAALRQEVATEVRRLLQSEAVVGQCSESPFVRVLPLTSDSPDEARGGAAARSFRALKAQHVAMAVQQAQQHADQLKMLPQLMMLERSIMMDGADDGPRWENGTSHVEPLPITHSCPSPAGSGGVNSVSRVESPLLTRS